MPTTELTSANYDDVVARSDMPVLIDFWAEWCGPCKMIGPTLEELSETFGSRVKIVKLNVDSHPDVAARYGVRAVPTMALVRNGAVADIKVGAAPKSVISQWLESVSQ
jgi:thioredoxin 1|nr:thioredoxin [Neorhizobium tomejilense]